MTFRSSAVSLPRFLMISCGIATLPISCNAASSSKRPMMASIAKQYADQLILTSDNPRDEEPADILNDMLEGLNEQEKQATLVIEDRRQAIRTACTIAQKNDVILIAGKGHEDYQIIKGVKHHFDDHEEVKAMM